ncbi:MAG: choice-of-anchor I family protein [Bacteroidota bacterium]
MKKITLLALLLLSFIAHSTEKKDHPFSINLVITEIFPGQAGTDLTADWFEIHNTGTTAWVAGIDADLYYDDESADGTTADLIQGITDIQPGERVIVLVTDNMAGEVATFNTVWGAVVDLTVIEVGYTDGAGLGGGGDAVNIWLGDPLTTMPIATGAYPDTVANDGQSYDVELSAFSSNGNTNFAVTTIALGGASSNVPNIASPGNVVNTPTLAISEIFPGQAGTDLTEDWFEIHNTGTIAWVAGVSADLYYDDESADGTTADLIQGITDIQPGERVIVLVTDNMAGEVATFNTVWSAVVDLTGIEVGYTDGAGLGGGGDTVNIWLGDPLTTMPIATGAYPDTVANDGQSYDLELTAFSVVANTSFAVATTALGGDSNNVPNIGSPGNVNNIPTLTISEIFPGQAGTDLTEDWFEIHNTGTVAWVAGVNADLYYDDESADGTTADLIQGITDIQPGERVIVLVTDNMAGEVANFNIVWGVVVDLTTVEVGYTDGSGLGSGGDAVNIWLGDPLTTMPIATGVYPDTVANDGQSYDVELGAFSFVGNLSFAVATIALGGDATDTPNIGSPGNISGVSSLVVTEIFPGQAGTDLTEDWFEIHNTGTTAWVSGVDPDLYYDDDSADGTAADVIQGITDIQPGERVIVLVSDNTGNEVNTFISVWGTVVDLSGVKVGYTDGSGLGASGDTVTLWLGDPTMTAPIASESYPNTAANDGQSYDLELAAFSTVGNASNAVATTDLGGDANDTPNIASPANALAPTFPTVQFDAAFTNISETGGNVTVTVNISQAPTTGGTVDVTLLTGGTAVEGTHFTYATTQTLTFPMGSTTSQTLNIPILDNMNDESDLFFVLSLTNESNVTVGGLDQFSVYILDDDTVVPTPDSSLLDVNYVTSYLVDASGTAEITAYDAASQRLFVTNDDTIEVLDFSDPTNITSISSIALPANTSGVQSVAVRNGVLAAAIAANPTTDNGFVMFSDIDGNNQSTVTVGALPDMITFTPDGTKLVVANEGEPSGDYTIDPEGSVSIIDMTGGLGNITQTDVTTATFTSFNAQQATLEAAGIRIFGPGATVAQDLEPEYITVSDDNLFAYVALQENNAYAIVDLTTNTITNVLSFGLKDHSIPRNSLDASGETDFIFNASWPIYGMYMPDAISFYQKGGTGYIVTANEGDARDYNAFQEERKLGDSDYNLDPAVFGDIDILTLGANLGDINISNASGNTDGDPEFEEIHVYGARSFSIFEASTGNLVYDSGNDFEVITAADATYGGIFNASNSNNSFKNRSDNKGPEPEGVIVQEIDGSYYAFVILERVGGVMIYDVTNPANPTFLQYLNNRGAVPGAAETGDLGPEGIIYVNENDSPTGTALLVISNEVSATLSIYSLDNVLSVDEFNTRRNSFLMYPNPAKQQVTFSIEDDYQVFDVAGRLVKEIYQDTDLDVSNLKTGLYIVKNSKGTTKKLIVE